MCGGSRETTVVNQSGTSEATPTEEERRLLQLDIEAREAIQPQQIEAQQSGLDLINLLLSGASPEELPGEFRGLFQGISPELTDEIAQEAVRDLGAGFQGAGILNSGVAAQVAGRVAGDIRRGVAEFNVGNRLNLLNLALSGQAQVQQPIVAQQALLNNQLAGLRSVATTGSSTQTVRTSNPFFSQAPFPSFRVGPFSF